MDQNVQLAHLQKRLADLQTNIVAKIDRLFYLLATGHPKEAEEEEVLLESLRREAADTEARLAHLLDPCRPPRL